MAPWIAAATSLADGKGGPGAGQRPERQYEARRLTASAMRSGLGMNQSSSTWL